MDDESRVQWYAIYEESFSTSFVLGERIWLSAVASRASISCTHNLANRDVSVVKGVDVRDSPLQMTVRVQEFPSPQ